MNSSPRSLLELLRLVVNNIDIKSQLSLQATVAVLFLSSTITTKEKEILDSYFLSSIAINYASNHPVTGLDKGVLSFKIKNLEEELLSRKRSIKKFPWLFASLLGCAAMVFIIGFFYIKTMNSIANIVIDYHKNNSWVAFGSLVVLFFSYVSFLIMLMNNMGRLLKKLSNYIEKYFDKKVTKL